MGRERRGREGVVGEREGRRFKYEIYDLMSLQVWLSTHPLIKSKLCLLVVSNLLYELNIHT